MPKLRTAKAASVAAVVEFAAEKECLQRSVGGREQKTFDEIIDWKLALTLDGRYAPYWELGPSTFAEYVQRAYWNNLISSEETGYVDPGWLRASPSVDESLLVDSSGRQHIVGFVVMKNSVESVSATFGTI
ncbi:MAG: hypothetical protein ACKPKO_40685, partial [Candidatus Fonsibacter sp.]